MTRDESLEVVSDSTLDDCAVLTRCAYSGKNGGFDLGNLRSIR
jgi:hypothetical protein